MKTCPKCKKYAYFHENMCTKCGFQDTFINRLWLNKSNFIWFIVATFAYSLYTTNCSGGGGSDGPIYPLDQTNESAEYQAEMMENYDPHSDYDPAIAYGDIDIPPDDDDFYGYPDTNPDTLTMSCPEGCTTHINGCDIKGNISEEGAKIYHVPGQDTR